jgi:hypothetical protein
LTLVKSFRRIAMLTIGDFTFSVQEKSNATTSHAEDRD